MAFERRGRNDQQPGLRRRLRRTARQPVARLLVTTLALLGVQACIPGIATAQEPAPGAGLVQQALRVFLDCITCDFDHVRRTIRFVDWARDQQDAEVHVLVTTQAAAAGTEYLFRLVGRRRALVRRSRTPGRFQLFVWPRLAR